MSFTKWLFLLFFSWCAAVAQPIYFDLDKHHLDDKAKKVLKDIMTNSTGIYLQIECHCDSLGTSPYNMALSQRRAETTRQYFIDNGFSAKHIRVAWFGKEQPAYDNNSPDRYKNRRCDITTQKPNISIEEFQGRKGEEFVIPNLVFVGNQPIPMRNSINVLDTLYELVRKIPAKLLIKGHVCCSDEQELSEKRAEQVKEYLVSRGIDANRLYTEGFSNRRPLAKEVNAKTREMNRRVEIEVLEELPPSILAQEKRKPESLYFEVLNLRQAPKRGNLDMQSKYNMQLIAQTLDETLGFTYEFEIFGPQKDRRMHEQLHSEIDIMMRRHNVSKARYRIFIREEIDKPGFNANTRYVFLRYTPTNGKITGNR
ncbi:MAG: OmpA family protein [Schleiferiaceae bacterium]|nr:OmpA family protein [Schleiferiaceae bacterium]